MLKNIYIMYVHNIENYNIVFSKTSYMQKYTFGDGLRLFNVLLEDVKDAEK